MEQQEDGCSLNCAERMRKMMKGCSRAQEDSEKTKEEVFHGREK
jgi:hypothetical protein